MKLSKILSIVMIAVMLVATLSNVVLAKGTSIAGLNIKQKNTNASNKVGDLGGQILQVIRTVGTIAAVITLIILGIKYMMGSAEEKAEYKKTLTPYIIGAVLVLAAVNIVNWIFGAAGNFFN